METDMTYELTSPLGFEMKVCSRCHGSGQYSYNQIDGSRCYGCHGEKKQYTKRGKAAKLFYVESLKMDPADVQVGQRIETMGGGKYTVDQIVGVEQQGAYMLPNGTWKPTMVHVFISRQGTRFTATEGFKVKLVPNAETKAKLAAAALAYQDTLTATGTPRKRAA
jgi:hypothetical protein